MDVDPTMTITFQSANSELSLVGKYRDVQDKDPSFTGGTYSDGHHDSDPTLASFNALLDDLVIPIRVPSLSVVTPALLLATLESILLTRFEHLQHPITQLKQTRSHLAQHVIETVKHQLHDRGLEDVAETMQRIRAKDVARGKKQAIGRLVQGLLRLADTVNVTNIDVDLTNVDEQQGDDAGIPSPPLTPTPTPTSRNTSLSIHTSSIYPQPTSGTPRPDSRLSYIRDALTSPHPMAQTRALHPLSPGSSSGSRPKTVTSRHQLFRQGLSVAEHTRTSRMPLFVAPHPPLSQSSPRFEHSATSRQERQRERINQVKGISQTVLDRVPSSSSRGLAGRSSLRNAGSGTAILPARTRSAGATTSRSRRNSSLSSLSRPDSIEASASVCHCCVSTAESADDEWPASSLPSSSRSSECDDHRMSVCSCAQDQFSAVNTGSNTSRADKLRTANGIALRKVPHHSEATPSKSQSQSRTREPPPRRKSSVTDPTEAEVGLSTAPTVQDSPRRARVRRWIRSESDGSDRGSSQPHPHGKSPAPLLDRKRTILIESLPVIGDSEIEAFERINTTDEHDVTALPLPLRLPHRGAAQPDVDSDSVSGPGLKSGHDLASMKHSPIVEAYTKLLVAHRDRLIKQLEELRLVKEEGSRL